ncbi:MAG: hypothetical protein K8H88_24675, partial [Sandaracinaceae bacterium]|nr:hypothetical protein [Sandaracinaceae bacterium]
MRALAVLLLCVLASCGGGPVVDPDAGDACASCTPDPCASAACPDPRHTCVSTSGMAECLCPAGTHAAGDRCEDDTTCTPTTCGPGGLCTDGGGTLRCECAQGYEGDRCERCAAGFFRDASGACDAD